MADPNNRRVERTPVTLKIKFKSETIDQFIERYAVDVSPGGIFIRTKEPLAVGTPMKFEFQLRDATPLIAGEGTVVWTRENDPSRPSVAPGMGVRFDRLVDGSQGVIDRILVEKAKQPQRAASVTARPFMDMPTRVAPLPNGSPQGDAAQAAPASKPFTDMPTRVAPLPSRDALLGGDTPTVPARRTPPVATPFQTDADAFAAEAFEEATKVRSLDDLVAATAEAAQLGRADVAPTAVPVFTAAVSVGGELDSHGRAGVLRTPDAGVRSGIESSISTQGNGGYPAANLSDFDSAPSLPSPPPHDSSVHVAADSGSFASLPRRRPTTAPPPMAASDSGRLRAELAAGSYPSTAGAQDFRSTRLGVEPAGMAQLPLQARATTSSSELAAEQASAVPPKRSSRMPTMIAVFVVAAAAGAIWYFMLRTDIQKHVEAPSPEAAGMIGSAGSAEASGGNGATGINAERPNPVGAVETEIASNAPNSTVSVHSRADAAHPGSKEELIQSGPAPLVTKLEKDKTYIAYVEAPGYLKSQLEVMGGQDPVTAKLVAKPHVLVVTSEPAGAQILINNAPTGKITPAEIELTASHRAKPRIHVQLHKAGFRWVDRIVEITGNFTEQDAKMMLNLTIPLAVAGVESGAGKIEGKPERRGGGPTETPNSGTPEPGQTGSSSEPKS